MVIPIPLRFRNFAHTPISDIWQAFLQIPSHKNIQNERNMRRQHKFGARIAV